MGKKEREKENNKERERGRERMDRRRKGGMKERRGKKKRGRVEEIQIGRDTSFPFTVRPTPMILA